MSKLKHGKPPTTLPARSTNTWTRCPHKHGHTGYSVARHTKVLLFVYRYVHFHNEDPCKKNFFRINGNTAPTLVIESEWLWVETPKVGRVCKTRIPANVKWFFEHSHSSDCGKLYISCEVIPVSCSGVRNWREELCEEFQGQVTLVFVTYWFDEPLVWKKSVFLLHSCVWGVRTLVQWLIVVTGQSLFFLPKPGALESCQWGIYVAVVLSFVHRTRREQMEQRGGMCTSFSFQPHKWFQKHTQLAWMVLMLVFGIATCIGSQRSHYHDCLTTCPSLCTHTR